MPSGIPSLYKNLVFRTSIKDNECGLRSVIYQPFVGSPEHKNISSNRAKFRKIGIWDMFDYSFDYIQCKPTQNIPECKQPTMTLKQPSL
jgi:hypothetical protein